MNRRATAGEMSASIAHELSQPLAAILLNAETAGQVLQSPAPDLGEVRDLLEHIRRDDHRASEVIGRLRNSELRRTGQPADIGTKFLTEIRRVDIDVLRQQFDASVLPMYIEQLESTPADASSLEPIVAPSLDEGPHLSYTIQWFIFSVCVLVGWVLAVRRSAAIRSGRPPKRRKSAYIPIADDESVR